MGTPFRRLFAAGADACWRRERALELVRTAMVGCQQLGPGEPAHDAPDDAIEQAREGWRVGRADAMEYAINRYKGETDRLVRAMDQHLATRTYFVDETYTIADICVLPWVVGRLDAAPGERPHLQAWARGLRERLAVRRGLATFDAKVRPEIIQGGLKGFDDGHRSILR